MRSISYWLRLISAAVASIIEVKCVAVIAAYFNLKLIIAAVTAAN